MQNVLVCVTLQNTCEKLIEAAQNLRQADDKLFVLHVVGVGQSLMGENDDGRILEYLYSVAQRVQADMTVLHAEDIAKTISAFVKEHDIQTLILGVPPQGESSLIRSLHASLGENCRILLVDKEKGVFI